MTNSDDGSEIPAPDDDDDTEGHLRLTDEQRRSGFTPSQLREEAAEAAKGARETDPADDDKR